MPGPAPTYQPTFTPAQLAECQRVARRHSAPQAQVYRARLALLLHGDPTLDNVSAGRRLGKHENWVRYWRRIWATEGFRLADKPGRGRKPTFSPLEVAMVKALACELPARRDQPLSRYSTAELARLVGDRPDAPPMSPSTIWRILDGAALQPWRSRSWLFSRDPQFAEKGGRVLDLYAGTWEGQPLQPDDCVLSADEKTSIQARVRRHASAPPLPGQPRRVEHEYERGGALTYLAAWDVRRGGVLGRCEATTGKAPFGRLVDQVMQQEPYRSARRVFWIVDQGSSHRGDTAARELQARYPNLILVHLPTHASWLNQIELYFSIVQRKALTPNDFPDLAAVARRLLAFEALYNDTARPFSWRFTRDDLTARLAHLQEAPAPEPAVPKAGSIPAVLQAA